VEETTSTTDTCGLKYTDGTCDKLDVNGDGVKDPADDCYCSGQATTSGNCDKITDKKTETPCVPKASTTDDPM
jgi:hypothetical protein